MRQLAMRGHHKCFSIIKHCTTERSGGEGFLTRSLIAQAERKEYKKIQCNKPPSPPPPTTGLRPYQAAGFKWEIRETAVIYSNDRSRLTVLNWIVKEAQHILYLQRNEGQSNLSPTY